jgi:hypothetical protein
MPRDNAACGSCRAIEPGRHEAATMTEAADQAGESATSSLQPPTISRAAIRADRFLAFLLLVLTFLLGAFAIYNSDFWQHLASGRLLARGEFQFGSDPFSYTTAGTYWTNSSWLYDCLLFILYNLADGPGLVAVKALLLTVLAWLLLQIRRPEQNLALPVAILTLAVLSMSNRFALQPVFVSFLFLGVTVFLLMKPELPDKRLWWLPVIFAAWANLDSSFILGPVTVALYTLGALLESWLGQQPNHSPRRLGMVLLVGLAACLANPHFFRVFVLPWELASMLVPVSEWMERTVGFPLLPAWSLAGGKTWHILNQAKFQVGMSPWFVGLSPQLLDRLTPISIAASVRYPVLAIGLLSFVLTPLLSLQGRPFEIKLARLLPWMFLGVFSLFQERLAAFFAVLSGPVTVLNIQDFLYEWRASSKPAQTARRNNLPGLGRFALGAALVVLLVLAWPGWLHGRIGDFSAPHRVAFAIRPDPAFQEAAQWLQDHYHLGGLNHGIFRPELAQYCAWFAPDVKGFWDYRFSLFSETVEQYLRFYEALWRRTGDYMPSLKALEAAYGVNFLAVTDFNRQTEDRDVTQRFWFLPERWPLLHCNGRVLIFGWNEQSRPDMFAAVRVHWDREAFAPVAEKDRVPSSDFAPEPSNPALAYALGQEPRPLEMDQAQLKQVYYSLVMKNWIHFYQRARLAEFLSGTMSVNAAVPWLASIPAEVISMLLGSSPVTRDPGPPAAPVLMVRHARRAIAQAPNHPEGYSILFHAYKTLWQYQENAWSQEVSYRRVLRQVQVTAALKTFLAIEPEEPRTHQTLADMYLTQLHYLDLAQEHLELAIRYFDRQIPPDAGSDLLKSYQKAKLDLIEQHKNLGAEITRRNEYFILQTSKGTPLQRAVAALSGYYRVVDEKNQEKVDRFGLGLARKSLNLLLKIKEHELKDEEKKEFIYREIMLFIMMGDVGEARKSLAMPFIKETLGPLAHELETLVGAATGDYALADRALAEQLKLNPLPQDMADYFRKIGSLLTSPVTEPPVGAAHLCALAKKFIQLQWVLGTQFKNAGELHLVRGLLALEHGNIPLAREQFAKALHLLYFPDRNIAQRYLELIDEQKMKSGR